MFIAALFTIAKTWKQPKCLLNGRVQLMDKEDVVCTHTETDTHIQRNISKPYTEGNNAFSNIMDGPGDGHTV